MSWVLNTRARTNARPNLIGPGRLVLVVGPSGAGKDTLIGGARAQCKGDQSVVFPRRVVTRPSSSAEEHDTLDAPAFERAKADGAFAFWWNAHGHSYGIPASVDDAIRGGRSVVCNVSRTMIAQLRQRYAEVAVVLVTAPAEILAGRLAGRDRASDGDLTGRLQRSAVLEPEGPADFVIHNVGKPQAGVRRLLNVIRDPGFYVIY